MCLGRYRFYRKILTGTMPMHSSIFCQRSATTTHMAALRYTIWHSARFVSSPKSSISSIQSRLGSRAQTGRNSRMSIQENVRSAPPCLDEADSFARHACADRRPTIARTSAVTSDAAVSTTSRSRSRTMGERRDVIHSAEGSCVAKRSAPKECLLFVLLRASRSAKACGSVEMAC